MPDAAPVIDEEQEVFDHLPSADVIVTGPVYDTNTGAELDLEKVATARKEELEWVQRQRVHKKVDAEDARKCRKGSSYNEMG